MRDISSIAGDSGKTSVNLWLIPSFGLVLVFTYASFTLFLGLFSRLHTPQMYAVVCCS